MATPPITNTARLHDTILAALVPITSINREGIVTPSSLQAAAQPTINAFDDSPAAQATFENSKYRANSVNDIDNNKTGVYKSLRSAAALLVDEENLIRQWLMSFKAEVAAATTLADLKARVATLPNMPDRTMAQAKNAMKAKVNSGDVD
jgi:hypothetical protein